MNEEWYLGIDPGLKTGMCVIHRATDDSLELLWSAELDEDEVAPALRHYLSWAADAYLGARFNVVVEKFFITANTAKKSAAPWSLELIGVTKQCCRDAGYPLELITWNSPDQKNAVTNPQLKALGLWHRGGAGHALDSMRHVVVTLKARGWVSAALLTK